MRGKVSILVELLLLHWVKVSNNILLFPRPKEEQAVDGVAEAERTPSPEKKIVLKKSRENLFVIPNKDKEQDPTRESSASVNKLP